MESVAGLAEIVGPIGVLVVVVAEVAEETTRLVAMPNTVEEAEQAATTMTLALVPLAVHLCMVEVAAAEAMMPTMINMAAVRYSAEGQAAEGLRALA